MNAPSNAFLASLRLPRHYLVEHADEAARALAMRLRRAVFCDEQGLFDGEDRDAVDATALLLVARPRLGGDDGRVGQDPAAVLEWGPPVGTVRIHQLEPGLWQGSRLAVAAEYRRVGALGGALIQLAVRSANTLGCERFIAQVQSANVALFRRLHWHSCAEIELHGRPHHLMEADLSRYPAFAAGEPMQVQVRRGA